MAVQTTYNETMDAARVGQPVNTEWKNDISRTVEDAAGVGFGLPVAQGANDGGCKATENTDTEILGITVREVSTDANDPDKFSQYMSARVRTKGVIWVVAAEGVAAGDPVYVTLATGAFGKTAGANILQIPNARWDSSASADGLAKVRLG
ncbi:MAG: hypothetical protein A49_08580 [Methyloceanibacter sp.]|nr:MAG: hypothetical protein A49_08580 [Methyloceanibacter sp.]